MKYWANENKRKKFKEKIQNNEKLYQKELLNKYSIEKIFEQKKIEKIEMPIEAKIESFWQKIIKKVKNIFSRSWKKYERRK